MPKPGLKTEEMTGLYKVMHVTTKPDTVARYLSINSVVNTALILMLLLTDGQDRLAFAQQFPAIVEWVVNNGVVLAAAGTAIGGAVAAFRKRAYNERSGDE